MAKIKNIEGMTANQIIAGLDRGGKFVLFTYAISIVVATFRRSSSIYYVEPGDSAVKYGLKHTLTTLVLGWWGIPWGPIYTIGALWTNLSGGKDVTQEIRNYILQQAGAQGQGGSMPGGDIQSIDALLGTQ